MTKDFNYPSTKTIDGLENYNIIQIVFRPTNVGKSSIVVFKNIEAFHSDDDSRGGQIISFFFNPNILTTKILEDRYGSGPIFYVYGIN